MENARRNAYDAAFKLKAIKLADKEGNRAAARKLNVNESMVRRWKRQREEPEQCKKMKKAFRGNKSRWPELENIPEDWVSTQRADGRGVSTVQIRLKAKTIATEKKIQDFKGGPSWCLRFMKRKGLSIRTRTTLCQQLHPEYKEQVWILTAWSGVKKSTITNGFRKAVLLRDGEDSTSSGVNLPQDESDTDSDNERETERVCGEECLTLFQTDTEEEDFHGFSTQEEDEDSSW
uniref:HTH CENPB-type domain-containing protein n=1 Tax=Takifugu rubripes TaxID=31033 RepID=A0A674MTW5_TAKRU